MIEFPGVAPRVGLAMRTQLARDYYLHVDGNDYSVDPRFIGRHVDATPSPSRAAFSHDGQEISAHERCWGTGQTTTDPAHVEAAAVLRARYYDLQRQPRARRRDDGHLVQIRPLTDYDALFGVNFSHPNEGASSS